MEKTACWRNICLVLLCGLLGCAAIHPEKAATSGDPSPQSVTVAVPAPPVPDESEIIRNRAKELLIGKWRRQIQGGDTIEFLEDGTVTFFSAVERVVYPGSYRILDKDQIEITMKNGGTLTWGYSVTKGDLTLTTPTGVDMKYRRSRTRP